MKLALEHIASLPNTVSVTALPWVLHY